MDEKQPPPVFDAKELLATLTDLPGVYRMLDAEGYPHAFLDHGPWRIEFVEAEMGGDVLHARVSITRRTQG